MSGWSVTARTLWQSWNGDAVRTLGTILRRPQLLKPRLCVANLNSLDVQHLVAAGVRAVILDKDNTVTAPYADHVHAGAVEGLQRLRDAFPGRHSVAILSNSAGTDDDAEHADARNIEASLGLPVIRHSHKKPRCFEDVMLFVQGGGDGGGGGRMRVDGDGVSARPITAAEVAVIGDRLLTDVTFGNLHGMYTVHCLPLSTVGDNPVAWLVRCVKRCWCVSWSGRFAQGGQHHLHLVGGKRPTALTTGCYPQRPYSARTRPSVHLVTVPSIVLCWHYTVQGVGEQRSLAVDNAEITDEDLAVKSHRPSPAHTDVACLNPGVYIIYVIPCLHTVTVTDLAYLLGRHHGRQRNESKSNTTPPQVPDLIHR
jgi:phosphatidylglycerophosphatase GEP4